jgi:hypothetical protein
MQAAADRMACEFHYGYFDLGQIQDRCGKISLFVAVKGAGEQP